MEVNPLALPASSPLSPSAAAAQEMSSSPSPVVRANLLVGLSDMVVQFTGLADAYVGRLAAMVRDPHELVRRQALALLANLLLRDFVKWRGALVHRWGGGGGGGSGGLGSRRAVGLLVCRRRERRNSRARW